jgi:uncharacterized membrane protein
MTSVDLDRASGRGKEGNAMARVLLVGESWFVHAIHQKGFDTFTTSEYEEGGAEFVAALQAAGHTVERIPAHLVPTHFPSTAEEIAARADVVVISDVGSNTFLLSRETFHDSTVVPSRIDALRDFALAGGGVLMIGGYMTFSGIDAKARWGRSSLAPVLPVDVLDRDDRVEEPSGIFPRSTADHPVTAGLDTQWPTLLGYNQIVARTTGEVLATVGNDPLLVVSRADAGRTAAFASDLATHWATPEFLAWPGYARLFDRLVRWLATEELA